jgi:hypothetical protein
MPPCTRPISSDCRSHDTSPVISEVPPAPLARLWDPGVLGEGFVDDLQAELLVQKI